MMGKWSRKCNKCGFRIPTGSKRRHHDPVRCEANANRRRARQLGYVPPELTGRTLEKAGLLRQFRTRLEFPAGAAQPWRVSDEPWAPKWAVDLTCWWMRSDDLPWDRELHASWLRELAGNEEQIQRELVLAAIGGSNE